MKTALLVSILAGGLVCGYVAGYSAKDYALHFPRKGATDYANIWGMNTNLSQFTVCFWMKSIATGTSRTIFSYAVPGQPNELVITGLEDFSLFIGNYEEKLRIREQANDGKWHHICVTWRNRYEIWGFYKDGRLVRWNWILTGGHRYVIKGGGSLVLGQSHDTNGGNFDPKRSFQGTLANVNVWSHALSDRQIKNLSKSCLAGVGDVYSWSDFRDGVKGKTAMVIPSPCHPHSSQE